MKKKLWETRVGFTIDGATVWQFVNFFVVPSIQQRCSNVGKKKEKNCQKGRSLRRMNRGEWDWKRKRDRKRWCAGMEGLVRVIYWLVLCFFHVPTVCWFFSLPYNSHKYLYSKWRNAQDSKGSWAIYRTLFGPDCACKLGFLDGASPKWKWPLRHLYHCRVCLSCAIYFHIGVCI